MGFFHRPELAQRLAAQVLDTSSASGASSGVFLAAPRRTGKSTFVREDLAPALRSAGALVLYVDLWSDLKADSGDLITAAVRTQLAQHEPALKQLAKAIGVSGGKLGGVEFSVDRIGVGRDVSLVQALVALSDAQRAKIVLVIDEAQHAITTEAGNAALFALKAARDELNSSAHHGLRIVCTGSNRDKLAMLRNSREQAFFGAPLVSFPHLGRDFVQWFCQQANLGAPLDPEATYAAFERSGWRPEILAAAADVVRFDLELVPADVAQRFSQAVDEQIEALRVEALRVVRSLTPLQAAVLRVMARAGADYAPFEATTLLRYRQEMERAGGDAAQARAEVPSVQQALTALQDKALVWRAARGVYAVEDQALVPLLLEDTAR